MVVVPGQLTGSDPLPAAQLVELDDVLELAGWAGHRLLNGLLSTGCAGDLLGAAVESVRLDGRSLGLRGMGISTLSATEVAWLPSGGVWLT
jgi:hypothetical protein